MSTEDTFASFSHPGSVCDWSLCLCYVILFLMLVGHIPSVHLERLQEFRLSIRHRCILKVISSHRFLSSNASLAWNCKIAQSDIKLIDIYNRNKFFL